MELSKGTLGDFIGDISDSSYNEMLYKFVVCVECNKMTEAQKYFQILKKGNDKQLARLGMRLVVGSYNKNLQYNKFSCPVKSNGRSCSPVNYFRCGYITYVIVDRAAFADCEKIEITFSRDCIYKNCLVKPIAGVKIKGRASYNGSEFGWIKGERNAGLMSLGKWTNEEVRENLLAIAKEFPFSYVNDVEKHVELIEKFHLDANESLFAEYGEKEYSVEMLDVSDKMPNVILRYTIGSWDQGDECLAKIKNYYEWFN